MKFAVFAVFALPVFGIPGKDFAEGLAAGFFGKSSGLEHCVESGADMEKDFGSLVSDIKARNASAAVEDISAIFGDVKVSLKACKQAGQQMKDIADALKDIHSVQDMLHHIKKNILQWDAQMLDELEQAAKVCTFQSPDAHECGRLIGKGSRQLIIGDSPSILGEKQMDMAFLQGFLTSLLGETEEVQKCAGDAGDVAGHAKKVIVDLKAREIEKISKDIAGLLAAAKFALEDCKEVQKDLEPFAHIMDGVKTKADLYKKIKKNALDNDKQVLDEVEDMFSSCTFKKPNATACGGDLGTIVKLFLIGSNPDVVV